MIKRLWWNIFLFLEIKDIALAKNGGSLCNIRVYQRQINIGLQKLSLCCGWGSGVNILHLSTNNKLQEINSLAKFKYIYFLY